MSSGENKFFFEEDPAEIVTGVTPTEQADVFGATLEELGISGAPDSMEPMAALVKRVEMKSQKNNLVLLEYGIVDKDYVLHITPVHPKRNLTDMTKLRAAIDQVIISLNKIIPFNIRVEIFLPRDDWEIKVLSFVVREGAQSWNLNPTELDTLIEGEILPTVADICNKQ